MSSMSDQAEKPIILDATQRPRGNVLRLIEKEKAERLQSVAEKLGRYSVEIIRESGDPYQRIYFSIEYPFKVVSTPVMSVAEGEVIVSMKNTANPNAPTDLDGLLHPREH